MSSPSPRGYLEISTRRPDMGPLVFDCASVVPKKGWLECPVASVGKQLCSHSPGSSKLLVAG